MVVDEQGNTPLHVVQTPEEVVGLLEHGGDINATNKVNENMLVYVWCVRAFSLSLSLSPPPPPFPHTHPPFLGWPRATSTQTERVSQFACVVHIESLVRPKCGH